jgi:hypothetical protein
MIYMMKNPLNNGVVPVIMSSLGAVLKNKEENLAV